MENEIRCAIELREDEGKPARLVGTLLPFGVQAQDRREVFEPGSLKWAAGGIVLNRQHQRAAPILRFTPVEVGNGLKVDVPLPDTTAGRDAAAEIRGGLFKGLSIEFRAVRERFVGGVRRISEAVLTGAGLVDSPSYSQATVEARARAEAAAIRERELAVPDALPAIRYSVCGKGSRRVRDT